MNGDFGCSVAVSGGTAVVGASYYGQSEGAAYVFVQNGTTWTEQAELAASDGATSDIFGVSTAVSGGTAIVGAPYHQVGANRHQGAAYVFVQSANRWTQQAELSASDGAVDDMFGFAVAESGVTVLIGASGHAISDGGPLGAAYVFERGDVTWTQLAELTAGGNQDAEFGQTVALSGGVAMVGEVGGLYRPGGVYLFAQSGTTWAQQTEITAGDSGVLPGLGVFGSTPVTLSGGTAVLGAPYIPYDMPSAPPGEAFIYEQEWCDGGVCTPVVDAGHNAGVTLDSGRHMDAGVDSGVSHDAQAPADSGTHHDATVRDAAADAHMVVAARDAEQGLYVGDIACGCRTAPDRDKGAWPAWMAFGVTALAGWRRRGRGGWTRPSPEEPPRAPPPCKARRAGYPYPAPTR